MHSAYESHAEQMLNAALGYVMGERTPYLDPRATGSFIGLTAQHTRGHMTRALMEGVLYSLRDGLEIMRGLDVDPTQIHAIGGGSTSELWLQLQADVLGAPVQKFAEGAAYGAALLGHVAAGTFADVDEAAKVIQTREPVTEPAPERVARYEEGYEVYRSLYGALREPMHQLVELAGNDRPEDGS
jgi:xylulokinase